MIKHWLPTTKKSVRISSAPCSGFCAINRVYSVNWSWKDKPFGAAGSEASLKARAKYESPDGYNHWIHAMYMVKEPVPTLKFDFDKFDGANGDTDGYKFWCCGYGGRKKPPSHRFEKAYARLAHNCGCAMGFGKPQNGPLVDEEFYTIMAIPEEQTLPEGYARFLVAGGMKFGHNLKKLVGDTATECFHRFDVL